MKTPNNFEEKVAEIIKEVFVEGRRYQQHVMQDERPKYIFTGALQTKTISTLCEEELLLRDLNSRIGEITRAYRFGYITKNYYERAKARNLKLYQENFKRLAELKGKE